MRQSSRQFALAVVAILFASPALFAQHHHHGHHHHHGGWYGPGWYGGGWGYSGGLLGLGRITPFYPYSYSFGYSSMAGFGGLSYYNGPVGVYGGMYGFAPYGAPGYGYLPMAPVTVQTRPLFIGGDPADNPAIQEWMPEKFKRPDGNAAAVPVQPVQRSVRLFVKPTSPEQKRKSIRSQAQADEWFVKANYLQAFARYKQASSAAPDRPEPRFRMAVTLAAMREFGSAVDELKRLIRLDPGWPAHGDRLDDLFGADHSISKNVLLHKVSAWVREDVRDPDRLFLMGVLLHFNEDADKAKTFFETASLLLGGDAEYVNAFLTPAAPREGAAPRAPAADAPAAEEEDVEAPVPKPLARPAPSGPAAGRPARELAGPRLLDPGVPLGAAPDGR